MLLTRKQRIEMAAALIPMEAYMELVQPKIDATMKARIKSVLCKDKSVAKRLRDLAQILELDTVTCERIFAVKDDRGRIIPGATIKRIADMVQL